jgi:predicted metal-dependent phosphoesterase TrpH
VNRRPAPAPGGRRVDLHTHTIFSDGLLTPEDLVDRAVHRQLAAIAVTDHDSVDGMERAQAAAHGRIEVVPGVEISSALDGHDLHILGYYIDPEHAPLLDRLARFQDERRERARRIVERLTEVGVRLDMEEVMSAAGPGVVGRPHVAAVMVRAGVVGGMDEAFRRYLGIHGSAFVPRPSFRPQEAIALIHGANGLSVLAHPGANLAEAVVERLAAAGLRGIEVWHPHHSAATTRRYRALAERLALLESGGSDFHGHPQGSDLGDVRVPYSALLRLKQSAGVAG